MTPQPTGLRAAAKPTSPATKALRERWRTKQSQQSLHQLGGTTIGHAVGVEQLVQAESIDQSGQQRECVVGVDIGLTLPSQRDYSMSSRNIRWSLADSRRCTSSSFG